MSLVSFLPWFPCVLAEEAKTKGRVDMDTKILKTIDTEQNHIHKKTIHAPLGQCMFTHPCAHAHTKYTHHCNITQCVSVCGGGVGVKVLWCVLCCVLSCLLCGIGAGAHDREKGKKKE